MLIDHTNVMGEGMPGAYLRRRGLMGVGQFDVTSITSPTLSVDTSSTSADAGGATTPGTLQDVLTGLNAEALYAINLARGQQGKPPLAASQYSPQVNVGVAPQTRNMVMIVAAIGLGALFLARR